jgi:hypothetical protein
MGRFEVTKNRFQSLGPISMPPNTIVQYWTKGGWFGLRGISTQLPFMLGMVSFGSGTSWWCCGVWAGVELSVVSSTGVKWCNSV